MTIFGENFIFHPNGTIQHNKPTEPSCNYIFFTSLTLNLLTTTIINPVVLSVRLKTAARSTASFLTSLLMVTDLVTNSYFPVLWGYKLLRDEEEDKLVYLFTTPYEVFNTCLLETVSLLSVWYLAVLSYLAKDSILNPLKRRSAKRIKRVIVGGTGAVVVLVITVVAVFVVVLPEHLTMIFSRYNQKVGDLHSIAIQIFLGIRSACIVQIFSSYLQVAHKLMTKKSGMEETRVQREKGGRAALAMSLAAIAGYIFELTTNFTGTQGNLNYYNGFVINCFIPSMLAAYNSFIQLALVKEVKKRFTPNRRGVVAPVHHTRACELDDEDEVIQNNNAETEL